MNDLIKNKKIIIFCAVLIIIFVIISLFNKKDNLTYLNTEGYEYLKNYESNEFLPVYVTVEDVAKKYLNEYKNNMLSNVEEAYNSLNKEYREKRFENLNGYKNYLKNFISLSIYSMELDKYSVTRINGNKIFNVYDKSGNQYIFKELSIMNYEVYLDEYTVEIK